MPENKKHHYVPRFYLKHFAKDGRSVNLYNFRLARAIFSANLKNQCFRDYMYGKEPSMEKSLSELEGGLAELMRLILRLETLPPPLSPDHESLCVLTLLQAGRTAYAADAADDFADGMWKQILAKDPRVDPDMLKRVRIVNNDPANFAVSMMLRNYHLIIDLEYKLLLAHQDGEFVTSDNPVVRYNQLMEFERFGSSTGLASKGLQIFFPLSPRHLAMFYDPAVYAVGTKGTGTFSVPTPEDMRQLNALQVVAALENVYFSGPAADIYRVVEAGRRFRRTRKVQVIAMPERPTATGASQLIQSSSEDVRMDLTLSFAKLRKPAKRWREERKRPGPKPAVVARNEGLFREHELFSLLVEQGRYQPTDFLRYLRERS